MIATISPELMLDIQIWLTQFSIVFSLAALVLMLDYLQGKYIDG